MKLYIREFEKLYKAPGILVFNSIFIKREMKGGYNKMNSKRGQSEIITTVLIILLVLAAIVIVWQVVQGTLNQGKKDIGSKKDCLGLDVVVVKAVAAKGTCSYAAPAPAGCTANNIVIGGTASNANCPTNTTCNTAATWTQSSSGSILIRREGTSVTKGVKTQLLINDKLNASHAAATDVALDTAYQTDSYTVDNLLVDTAVQITPILADNTACGLTDKFKVTAA